MKNTSKVESGNHLSAIDCTL